MSKKLYLIISVLVLFALTISACGTTATEAPEPTEPPAEQPTDVPEPTMAPFRVGFVTDTGGIDDQSFNTTQWSGIQRASSELGVEAQFIQSVVGEDGSFLAFDE